LSRIDPRQFGPGVFCEVLLFLVDNAAIFAYAGFLRFRCDASGRPSGLGWVLEPGYGTSSANRREVSDFEESALVRESRMAFLRRDAGVRTEESDPKAVRP